MSANQKSGQVKIDLDRAFRVISTDGKESEIAYTFAFISDENGKVKKKLVPLPEVSWILPLKQIMGLGLMVVAYVIGLGLLSL